MPWLMRDEKVLAAVEVAESFRDRSRGLLGRDGFEGALLIRPVHQVHSFGMRFPLDVAFCTKEMLVVRTLLLKPRRITRPSIRCCCVIEAEAGAFARWELKPGDVLAVEQ